MPPLGCPLRFQKGRLLAGFFDDTNHFSVEVIGGMSRLLTG